MDRNTKANFGIQAIQIYFPKTYVNQEQMEIFDKVSAGKYTKGLGQQQLCFTYPFEDINSMSLTAVSNLLKNNNINPKSIGRIQVGTQTLIDKSKSTKTILMDIFKQNPDIEGATSLNDCYGATNALLNSLNWLQSESWDGRYAIVVASDIALFENGAARSTGGAGAIAILLGPNAKITIDKFRASYSSNTYDFYKPNPFSEYPIVSGKQSIESYIYAAEKCYQTMKLKTGNKNYLSQMDYFCFHSTFSKMVHKALHNIMIRQKLTDNQMNQIFTKKLQPCLILNKKLGNLCNGSVFASLISLLINNPTINNKKVCFFSYGSGVCSTMLTLNIHQNILTIKQIQTIKNKLEKRIKISPEQYNLVMKQRQQSYGKYFGNIPQDFKKIDKDVYFLSQIDSSWKRKYQIKKADIETSNTVYHSLNRLQQAQGYLNFPKTSKFYELSIEGRRRTMENKLKDSLDMILIDSGGLSLKLADTMIENVIGRLSLPLSIVPHIVINEKDYMVPMCIQQPSVVAACSSIGKFLSNYSFYTSSTLGIMVGQVHLPKAQINQIHKILSMKKTIIQELNKQCDTMIQRGGGVTDIKIRQLRQKIDKQYVVDIHVHVCDSMGANTVTTLAQHAKTFISNLGIKTGIAILSNYCTQRKSSSWFEILIEDMAWKNYPGSMVADKIIQAYQFAKSDQYRAVTHNKGIMNGIDAVCVATGQDWRAVQASSHCFASRSGKYLPLTHYQIVNKDGVQFFRAQLQLPIAIGTKGGAINKNPLYREMLKLLGNPNARQLSQIIVSIGLAQNFAALRALAIEGIQKGHMGLHIRTLVMQNRVPEHLIKDAIEYLKVNKKYNKQALQKFLMSHQKPKL